MILINFAYVKFKDQMSEGQKYGFICTDQQTSAAKNMANQRVIIRGD